MWHYPHVHVQCLRFVQSCSLPSCDWVVQCTYALCVVCVGAGRQRGWSVAVHSVQVWPRVAGLLLEHGQRQPGRAVLRGGSTWRRGGWGRRVLRRRWRHLRVRRRTTHHSRPRRTSRHSQSRLASDDSVSRRVASHAILQSNAIVKHKTARVRMLEWRSAGTGLCSYRVRRVDGSCAEHLTVESYTGHLCC